MDHGGEVTPATVRRAAILSRILDERRRQDRLHPCLGRDDGERLAALVEEVGEVGCALVERDRDGLVVELVQVAACVVRWLEEIATDEGG